MAKKYDLPAMPFYFGDWMKAPEIRALELGDRMIWFEMLGFMWESTERGYLTINNKPIQEETLARMLGLTIERLRVGLAAMSNLNVFSTREDGAIYSRRMVGDNAKREKFREFGKKGGNPKLIGLRGGLSQGIRSAENENENETVNETVNENNKKEYFLGIFNTFLPPELQADWCAYLDYCYERGDIKLNRSTITEQAKFIREHIKDAKKIMRESVKNNWKGLFELKEVKHGVYERYLGNDKLKQVAIDIANDPDLKR